MRDSRWEKKTFEQTVLVESSPTCDFCGFIDHDEDEVFALRIESSMDTCGHERITRDICHNCYQDRIQKHWDFLTMEFKEAGNDDELREYHEDI